MVPFVATCCNMNVVHSASICNNFKALFSKPFYRGSLVAFQVKINRTAQCVLGYFTRARDACAASECADDMNTPELLKLLQRGFKLLRQALCR